LDVPARRIEYLANRLVRQAMAVFGARGDNGAFL
jgi:hypothetical protein